MFTNQNTQSGRNAKGGLHVTGPPTARGSLILNEQNTGNSTDSQDKKAEESFHFPSGRPGFLLVVSKLLPCFSCCQKRNAQIVQESNKCGTDSDNFGYENKQVIEHKLENLGEITGSEHVAMKRQRDLKVESAAAAIGGNETDEYIFNSQDERPR